MLKEYAEALIVALILAFIIRSFVVQAFKIPSGSMLQTLQIGDHLLVTKFAYGIKIPFTNSMIFEREGPERADIIVFEFPEDPSKDFIKRVVAVPGDVVEIREKKLFLNGEEQHESYIQHVDTSTTVPRRDNFGPVMVPENKYFVLGDNRDESYDSRFWGFVERDTIAGKALILYWSWESLTNIRWERIGQMVE